MEISCTLIPIHTTSVNSNKFKSEMIEAPYFQDRAATEGHRDSSALVFTSAVGVLGFPDC